MTALEYINAHPAFLVLMLLSTAVTTLIIIRVIKNINRDDSDDDIRGDDDGGGFGDFDPDLDLPPGVSLPIDREEPVTA